MFIDIIKQEAIQEENVIEVFERCKKCGNIIHAKTKDLVGGFDNFSEDGYCGQCWYKMSVIKDDEIYVYLYQKTIIFIENHCHYSSELFEYEHHLQYHNFFIGV
jgi:hypothetical protein